MAEKEVRNHTWLCLINLLLVLFSPCVHELLLQIKSCWFHISICAKQSQLLTPLMNKYYSQRHLVDNNILVQHLDWLQIKKNTGRCLFHHYGRCFGAYFILDLSINLNQDFQSNRAKMLLTTDARIFSFWTMSCISLLLVLNHLL